MAKLLNKDPQLYEAERERFLRELRQFHLNQRWVSRRGFARVFKRKGSRSLGGAASVKASSISVAAR